MPHLYSSEPNAQTPHAVENALTQEPANFFSEGSYSPHFQLCRPLQAATLLLQYKSIHSLYVNK